MQACAKGKLDLQCFDGKQHKAEFTFLLQLDGGSMQAALPCQHGTPRMSLCYCHSFHLYNTVQMTS